MMIFLGKILYYFDSFKKKVINQFLQQRFSNKMKTIGANVRFNGISYMTGLSSIEIGNNVHIGDNAFIRGEGGLEIGDNTHISRNLVIYTVNHEYQDDLLPYNNKHIKKKVIIQKNVWIGMNVIILPGSIIEEGAIIGAGSVIAGRVSRLSIFGASLATQIKKRDEGLYQKLDEEKRYGGINGEAIK